MASNLIGIETEACILLVPELLVDQPPVVIRTPSTPWPSSGFHWHWKSKADIMWDYLLAYNSTMRGNKG